MNAISIISLIIAILGIYPLILFIISFINRPYILIGVLPIIELKNKKYNISDLGVHNSFDEFHFKKKFFAQKVKKLNLRNLTKNADKIRNFKRTFDNQYELPILINNIGRSDLVDYNLVVSFSNINYSNEVVKIIDIKTESTSVDALYCDENYQGSTGKELIPSIDVRKYYYFLKLNDQLVIFKGSLESYVFELLYMKILIPDTLSNIFITYKLYPINKWDKSFKYAQLLNIVD